MGTTTGICLLLLLVGATQLTSAAPAPAPAVDAARPGCAGPKACGSSGVREKNDLDPRVIDGITVKVFACLCNNEKKLVVTDGGAVLLDLTNNSQLAPSPPPRPPPRPPPPPPPSPPSAPPPPLIVIPSGNGYGWPTPDDYRKFFSGITYRYENGSYYYPGCSNVDTDLLWRNGSASACATNVVLGATCDSFCSNTMKALGLECWAQVFVEDGGFDPTEVGSTRELQYKQCTARVPYTTLAVANAPAIAPSSRPESDAVMARAGSLLVALLVALVVM